MSNISKEPEFWRFMEVNGPNAENSKKTTIIKSALNKYCKLKEAVELYLEDDQSFTSYHEVGEFMLVEFALRA